MVVAVVVVRDHGEMEIEGIDHKNNQAILAAPRTRHTRI